MSMKRRLGKASRGKHRRAARRTPIVRRGVAGATALLLGASMAPGLIAAQSASAAPEGQGFALNASDLRFIFHQIEIAEHHAATATTDNRCGTLVGDGPDQLPNVGNGKELPFGLRTVDGSCNNVFPLPGRDQWGAADTVFPRLVPAAPRGGYANPGTVVDATPRQVSNLIVDQTANNPAAVAAELGVSSTALYRAVDGRWGLERLVGESLLGDLKLHDDPDHDIEQHLLSFGLQMWHFIVRHPGLGVYMQTLFPRGEAGRLLMAHQIEALSKRGYSPDVAIALSSVIAGVSINYAVAEDSQREHAEELDVTARDRDLRDVRRGGAAGARGQAEQAHRGDEVARRLVRRDEGGGGGRKHGSGPSG